MNAPDPENSKDIVRRARMGDSTAFAQLYSAYFTPLYRYLYFRVTNKSDADDLTQEVFLKAYASFGSFVPLTESPLPYFYTIARNCLIDHYRKKKSVVVEEEQLHAIADESDSAEEKAAKEEEFIHLRKAITELSSDQQDAIVLKYITGLTNAEIATLLGKNEEAIRQLQSRGIRTLRKKYSKN